MKRFLKAELEHLRLYLIGIFLVTLFGLPESLIFSIILFVILIVLYIKPICFLIKKKK